VPQSSSSRASSVTTTAPNVSIDFNHDPHSSTFHMDQTKVQNGTLVRVMAWYDNEWGFFSNRMGRHRRGDGETAVGLVSQTRCSDFTLHR